MKNNRKVIRYHPYRRPDTHEVAIRRRFLIKYYQNVRLIRGPSSIPLLLNMQTLEYMTLSDDLFMKVLDFVSCAKLLSNRNCGYRILARFSYLEVLRRKSRFHPYKRLENNKYINSTAVLTEFTCIEASLAELGKMQGKKDIQKCGSSYVAEINEITVEISQNSPVTQEIPPTASDNNTTHDKTKEDELVSPLSSNDITPPAYDISSAEDICSSQKDCRLPPLIENDVRLADEQGNTYRDICSSTQSKTENVSALEVVLLSDQLVPKQDAIVDNATHTSQTNDVDNNTNTRQPNDVIKPFDTPQLTKGLTHMPESDDSDSEIDSETEEALLRIGSDESDCELSLSETTICRLLEIDPPNKGDTTVKFSESKSSLNVTDVDNSQSEVETTATGHITQLEEPHCQLDSNYEQINSRDCADKHISQNGENDKAAITDETKTVNDTLKKSLSDQLTPIPQASGETNTVESDVKTTVRVNKAMQSLLTSIDNTRSTISFDTLKTFSTDSGNSRNDVESKTIMVFPGTNSSPLNEEVVGIQIGTSDAEVNDHQSLKEASDPGLEVLCITSSVTYDEKSDSETRPEKAHLKDGHQRQFLGETELDSSLEFLTEIHTGQTLSHQMEQTCYKDTTTTIREINQGPSKQAESFEAKQEEIKDKDTKQKKHKALKLELPKQTMPKEIELGIIYQAKPKEVKLEEAKPVVSKETKIGVIKQAESNEKEIKLPKQAKQNVLKPEEIKQTKPAQIKQKFPKQAKQNNTKQELVKKTKQKELKPEEIKQTLTNDIKHELPKQAKKSETKLELPKQVEQNEMKPELPNQAKQSEMKPELLNQAKQNEIKPELPKQSRQNEMKPELLNQARQKGMTPDIVKGAKQNMIVPEMPKQAMPKEMKPELPKQEMQKEKTPGVGRGVKQIDTKPGLPKQANPKEINLGLPKQANPKEIEQGKSAEINPEMIEQTKPKVIKTEVSKHAEPKEIKLELIKQANPREIKPGLPEKAKPKEIKPVLLKQAIPNNIIPDQSKWTKLNEMKSELKLVKNEGSNKPKFIPIPIKFGNDSTPNKLTEGKFKLEPKLLKDKCSVIHRKVVAPKHKYRPAPLSNKSGETNKIGASYCEDGAFKQTQENYSVSCNKVVAENLKSDTSEFAKVCEPISKTETPKPKFKPVPIKFREDKISSAESDPVACRPKKFKPIHIQFGEDNKKQIVNPGSITLAQKLKPVAKNYGENAILVPSLNTEAVAAKPKLKLDSISLGEERKPPIHQDIMVQKPKCGTIPIKIGGSIKPNTQSEVVTPKPKFKPVLITFGEVKSPLDNQRATVLKPQYKSDPIKFGEESKALAPKSKFKPVPITFDKDGHRKIDKFSQGERSEFRKRRFASSFDQDDTCQRKIKLRY